MESGSFDYPWVVGVLREGGADHVMFQNLATDPSNQPPGRALRSTRLISLGDSCVAGAFLSLYVAAYLAVGFAAIAAIEWVWMKLVS